MSKESESIHCRPLSGSNWADLEALFGPRGACGGCWCMWWRLPHRLYEAQKGEANRLAFWARVEAGPPPGVLAYSGEDPVGWCSIAPRPEFRRLETSRLFPPFDDQPVWSITCLFIRKDRRGGGVSRKLVESALDFAASQGAEVVEAYAVDPQKRTADVFLSSGPASLYRTLGFRTVSQPSRTRHLMRVSLSKSAGSG